MRKIQYLFIALFICLEIQAQDKFNIRGVLPWHNFLSGPTSWNLSDYRIYLDECRKNGINFIGFHNYTGGGERYATYVEPMIKIEYKNILPQACFDNSMTARWGYLPMAVKDFAFDTGKIFQLPVGAEAFGNNGSITSHSSREHYEKAQSLMRDVLKMAHERGIRMAMGFEFGVIPPEYFSLNVDPTARPLNINVDYWDAIYRVQQNIQNVLDGKTQQSELNGLEAAYYKICKSFLTGDVTTSNAWAAYTSRIQATGLLTKENLDENQPPLSLGSQEIKIPEELLEEEKNTFLQIIVGEKPPEYFDTFVKSGMKTAEKRSHSRRMTLIKKR